MSFQTTYRELFRVNLWHHYYLSDGVGSTIEAGLLTTYNFREFAHITPTEETKIALQGHKMVFKQAQQGFVVYVKVEGVDSGNPLLERTPLIALEEELQLVFTVSLTSPYFYNFTDLSFGNPLYFGNAALASQPGLDRIQLEGASTLIDDTSNYRLSDESWETLQSSIPTSTHTPAVIALTMRGDSNITTATGLILATSQRYVIHLKNRETIWEYRNSADSSLVLTTGPHQLTKFGYREVLNAGRRLPNPQASTPINASNISEIFI